MSATHAASTANTRQSGLAGRERQLHGGHGGCHVDLCADERVRRFSLRAASVTAAESMARFALPARAT
jgi:hypothetical protein